MSVQSDLDKALGIVPHWVNVKVVEDHLDKEEFDLAWAALELIGDEFIVGSEAEACFWRPMAKAAFAMFNGKALKSDVRF